MHVQSGNETVKFALPPVMLKGCDLEMPYVHQTVHRRPPHDDEQDEFTSSEIVLPALIKSIEDSLDLFYPFFLVLLLVLSLHQRFKRQEAVEELPTSHAPSTQLPSEKS